VTLLETLVQPFQFEFMRYAMTISVLVAVPAALLSCFLVLKGWSLMGDAVSHAVFPGVVIAYIVGIPFGIGAFAAGMICALATGYLKDNSRIKQDTVMGVVFSGMFGLGIVLFTWIQSDVHLDHILFGDMLGIGPADLLETASLRLSSPPSFSSSGATCCCTPSTRRRQRPSACRSDFFTTACWRSFR
jgi:manganese/iron transport system permease protein